MSKWRFEMTPIFICTLGLSPKYPAQTIWKITRRHSYLPLVSVPASVCSVLGLAKAREKQTNCVLRNVDSQVRENFIHPFPLTKPRLLRNFYYRLCSFS